MTQAQEVAAYIRWMRAVYREEPRDHGMSTRALNTWTYRLALSYARHTIHAHDAADRIDDKTARRLGYR